MAEFELGDLVKVSSDKYGEDRMALVIETSGIHDHRVTIRFVDQETTVVVADRFCELVSRADKQQ